MNWYKKAQQKDRGFREKFRDFGRGLAFPLMFGGGTMLATSPEITNLDESTKENPAIQQPANTYNLQQPQSEPAIPKIEENQNSFSEQNTPEGNIISRIIFSEASPIVSDKERELVASVILNRINHPGFGRGNLETMEDVVTQPGAFEALNDANNTNWERSGTPKNFSGKELQSWLHSVELSKGNFTPKTGPSGNPLVYYHDKSIKKPRSWDNRYWKAIKEIETPHFIFYSVVPNKSD